MNDREIKQCHDYWHRNYSKSMIQDKHPSIVNKIQVSGAEMKNEMRKLWWNEPHWYETAK